MTSKRYLKGAARLKSKTKIMPNGCHEWQGFKTSKGYGQIGVDRTIWRAHRYAYFVHYGVLPGDLDVCHTCDNPPCVNPDHLFLGTNKDNHDDKIKKGRWGGPPRLLSPEQLSEIKDNLVKGKHGSAVGLAAKFGVSRRTINKSMKRIET